MLCVRTRKDERSGSSDAEQGCSEALSWPKAQKFGCSTETTRTKK